MPVQRPLSPHLQIYRPQITSTLSIMHRFSGLFLCLGAVALIAWIIILAQGPSAYACWVEWAESPLFQVFGALVVLALNYHLVNGLRHLVWDTGRGFSVQSVQRSGIVVLVLAALGTAASLYCLRGGA